MNYILFLIPLAFTLSLVQSTEIHSWPVFTGWPGFGLLGYYGRRNGPYHFMNVKHTTTTVKPASTKVYPTTTSAAPYTSSKKMEKIEKILATTGTTVRSWATSTPFTPKGTKVSEAILPTTTTPKPLPTVQPLKLFLEKSNENKNSKPTLNIAPVTTEKSVNSKITPKV